MRRASCSTFSVTVMQEYICVMTVVCCDCNHRITVTVWTAPTVIHRTAPFVPHPLKRRAQVTSEKARVWKHPVLTLELTPNVPIQGWFQRVRPFLLPAPLKSSPHNLRNSSSLFFLSKRKTRPRKFLRPDRCWDTR